MDINEINIGDRYKHYQSLKRKNGTVIPKGSFWIVVGKGVNPKRIQPLREVVLFKGDGNGAHVGDILESSIKGVNAVMGYINQ